MNTKRNGILAIALIGFLSVSSVVFAANARPNVLWIIAEDMSQDLGCYGNELVHTPNIDGLAREGMHFDRMFTTGPACSPSRTALATGVLPDDAWGLPYAV